MIREKGLPVDTSEEKLSGYYVSIAGEKPKEIILGKQRGRPRKIRNKKWYPMDKKVEVCTLYAVYGNVEEVSKLTKVPENHIRSWKQESWWIELTKQIYIEQNENLAASITGVLDKTLEHLKDRLEHGDFVYTKAGQLTRKPVDTRVLTLLFDNLAVQRRLNRGEPTSISAKLGTEDRLQLLQEQFEKFSKAKTIEGEVVDAIESGIQEEL